MGDLRGAAPDEGGLLAAAAALTPYIRERRDEIERERRLPPELVERMRAAQLFQLWVPKSLGGPEVSPRSLVKIIKELARADGSVGWCAAVTSVFGLMAPGLADAVAREIFGERHILAGSINPVGKAMAAPGGFRLSGRWGYGSGIDACDWVGLGAMVHDGDVLRRGPGGAPDGRFFLLPRSAVTVIDTWNVSGLRGTGSHDLTVTDLFVPEERVGPAFVATAKEGSPLYRIPPISLFATALAAITLGIARAAIDAFIALASAKTPMGATVLLRERPQAQANVGRAEALVGAAEAYLLEALDALWDECAAGNPTSLAMRAAVRAANTFAGEASARAVDLMHEAAGGSAIYENGIIARCFRDVHAATQHIGLASNTYEIIGRVKLGLDLGVPRF